MTLAGLSLAIGPMVDSAIICLENTHRHLGLGASPEEAAFLRRQRGGDAGAGGEPLHAAVLAPLAFMPGLGEFLYRPMAAGVAFAMISAYVLSRSFVPSRSARWLKAHVEPRACDHESGRRQRARRPSTTAFGSEPTVADRRAARRGLLSRAFARWEA